MAPAQRQSTDLLERLALEGPRFGFFAAVQLIQRLFPQAARVGELGPPEAEVIRFRHDPSLVFHSSDIAGIRVTANGEASARLEITTTFLGLVGFAAPLATVFSEDVLRADWRDETSLRAFYDLFHHRLLSLFFRSWQRSRFDAAYELGGDDGFTRRMLAFVGTDLGGARPTRGLPPLEMLALAQLIASGSRSARTVQIVVERFVGCPVRIEQFVARTVRIAEDQRCLIGLQNCTLGEDFAIGASVTDRSGRFRVVVGPVDYASFESLMPGGRRHAQLRDVVMQFSPAHLEPEVEIFVDAEHTPRFHLGGEIGSQLGVSTHLPAEQSGALRARITLSENPLEVAARYVAADEGLQSLGLGRNAPTDPHRTEVAY